MEGVGHLHLASTASGLGGIRLRYVGLQGIEGWMSPRRVDGIEGWMSPRRVDAAGASGVE